MKAGIRKSVFDAHFSPEQLAEVDELVLSSGFSRARICEQIQDKYAIKVTPRQLRYREQKLKETLDQEQTPFDREIGVIDPTGHRRRSPKVNAKGELTVRDVIAQKKRGDTVLREAHHTFGELEKHLVSLIDLDIESIDNEDGKNVLTKLKEDVQSKIRYAKELFTEVPYLAYLNFSINLMQLRISKRFEMETRLNVIMRDNSTDLKMMVEMIEKAITLQQSLGMMPQVQPAPANVNTILFQQQNLVQGHSETFERVNEYRSLYRQIQDASPDTDSA